MQAWLLPAFASESPRRYYAYAAIYTVPALLGAAGLPDTGVFLLTVLGAVNMQVRDRSATLLLQFCCFRSAASGLLLQPCCSGIWYQGGMNAELDRVLGTF